MQRPVLRAAVLLGVALMVAIASAAAPDRDPCDQKIVAQERELADAKIAAREKKLGTAIEATKRTIAEWEARIAAKDPECAPDRLNCPLLLKKEKNSLHAKEREMPRELAEMRDVRDRAVKQAIRDCAAQKEAPSAPDDVKCVNGRCTCTAPKAKLVQKESALGEPLPDGCSYVLSRSMFLLLA